MSESYFTFRNKFYKPTSGAAMGNHLSSLLCDVFMENLKNELEGLWYSLDQIRYVDDVLAIIKRRETWMILKKLNQSTIEFTMEIKKEGKIPFLKLKIIWKRGDFEVDIYTKPTQT